MAERIDTYLKKISEKKGSRAVLRRQLMEIIKDRKKLRYDFDVVVEAKVIVQTVAKETQKRIEYQVSELVTTTLSATFPEPYKFALKFEERRNKTEADLIFMKGKNETDDILFTGGGGVADVASFIIGIAIFSINPARPVIIRDEAFKFLHSPEFQEKVSKIIKRICDKFNLQIILISDQPSLYKEADNVIDIGIEDGKSFIKQERR